MDNRLREERPRGTMLYPFQLYQMSNRAERIDVPYHWHSEIEVLAILEGSLSLTVNGEKLIGSAGDLFWIEQECLHGMIAGEAPVSYDAFVFPMEFLNFEGFDYTQSHFLTPLCRKEKRLPLTIPKQCAHYEHALEELSEITRLEVQHTPGYQIGVKACLLKFVSLLIQDGLLHSSKGKTETLSDFKLKNLKAILTYIQQHYSERLTLPGIAGEFGLSPKYFSRYFKQNLDRTFVEYLNGFRIERAAELLLNTDLPVGEIAPAVGFENFSYFIRQFKEIRGCTPSRFRAEAQPQAMYPHGTLFPLSESK